MSSPLRTMAAVTFFRFGPPSVLTVKNNHSMPHPSEESVLIQVKSAGLNPVDCKIRWGSSFLSKKLEQKFNSESGLGMGYDFSGTIVETGERVNHFKVGDAVMGLAGFPLDPRCYAEYLCVGTDTIIHKPEHLPFPEAAGLPTAGLTAYQALARALSGNEEALELNGLGGKKTIVIHAGAGGVGHIAIQLAKQSGSKVITTASINNHPFLKSLGADRCIDYNDPKGLAALFEESPVDIVIDLVGGNTGKQSIDLLSPQGILVTVPTNTADEIIALAKEKNRTAVGIIKKDNMGQLQRLANNTQLKIEISGTFKLSEAPAAHALLENGHTRGKLVFRM